MMKIQCKECGHLIEPTTDLRDIPAQQKGFCTAACRRAYLEVMEWQLDMAAREFGMAMRDL